MHSSAAALALLSLFSPALVAQGGLDPKLPNYESVSGITGNLNSVGSDTLNNLMSLWTDSFKRTYPSVNIQVEGKGSATAPTALIEGVAQLGPMSRPMKASEIDAFEKKFGYKPTAVRVAIDALAVYVHKDCPLEELSMPQVDAIFSKNRKLGFERDVKTWADLGLTGEWAGRPMSLYGRNAASGTYAYFKEHALGNGDYKDTVKEQPGSASVVQGVAKDPFGIGYSGLGYKTSEVKALRLAPKPGAEAVSTDAEMVYAGKYPLSRYLYVYINKAPNRPLEPLTREFLRFVVSREGQEVVIKDGYLPIRSKVALATVEELKS